MEWASLIRGFPVSVDDNVSLVAELGVQHHHHHQQVLSILNAVLG